MKKTRLITSLALIALMVSLFTMPAFAAPNLPADSDVSYWDIRGESTQTTTGNGPDDADLIPVYGYVGETTTLEDTDPEDESVEPTPVENEINVSVPIKIIWAAFESDGGTITAPNYHIRNNSLTKQVKVELTSFTADSSDDNTTVDSDLELILKSNGADINLLDFVGTPVLENALPSTTNWDFTLGGTYSGEFGATAYQPSYMMVLTFTKVGA
jgi:hypothetical protein